MTQPEPSPPRRPALSGQIWVLVVAAFVIAVGFGLIAPVLPQFAASFDVGVTAASAIVSVFAFTRLVFAPYSGRLVQRLGERRVYLTGLVIVAASTGACALAQTYWQLMLFRGLGGFGSTMFTISAMALLIRLAPPDQRGRVNGLYGTAFLLGGVTGPLLGGALGGLGLRVPFVVYTVALVIATLVVAVALPSTRAGAGGSAAALPPLRLREALGHPTFRAALFSGLAHGWATFGVRVSLVPLFVAAALTAGPGTAGVGLAVFSVGMTAALTPSGRLTDRVGRKPLVVAGLTVAGSATVALGLASSVMPFYALCLLGGVGTGLFAPAMQAAVADVVGSERSGGPALAAFQMASDIGAIAGPVAAGALAQFVSYPAAFAVTGGVCLLAALAWVRAPETLPSRVAATKTGDGRED